MGSANSGSIRKESVKVLARIVAFVFYYILLIALGALIFVAAFFLSKYLIIYLFPEIHSGRLIVLLVLVILGIWCLAGAKSTMWFRIHFWLMTIWSESSLYFGVIPLTTRLVISPIVVFGQGIDSFSAEWSQNHAL